MELSLKEIIDVLEDVNVLFNNVASYKCTPDIVDNTKQKVFSLINKLNTIDDTNNKTINTLINSNIVQKLQKKDIDIKDIAPTSDSDEFTIESLADELLIHLRNAFYINKTNLTISEIYELVNAVYKLYRIL